MNLKPYKTTPLLKEKLWGGERLKDYGKSFEGASMGESWETYSPEGTIPLLVKFIDANDVLSVQVHPGDEYARRVEGRQNGKNELWIVLDCAEDASIVYGFNRMLDKDELREFIQENRLVEVLNVVRVKKGDCIFLPSGTVHSLGQGVLVYELQQPSDLTYRFYDWDRCDGNGEKRELHIEKALEVADLSAGRDKIINIYDFTGADGINIVKLAQCEFFCCFYLQLRKNNRYRLEKGSFRAISCISGAGRLAYENEELELKKGETCIIPREYGEAAVISGTVDAEFIVAVL